MAVRIRMKQFGRKHRPYFRICAMDIRRPRDGRVLEQLGTYDPLVPETDARAVFNGERIAYWLSVGATPSDKVQVLIKKYGAGGTHVAAQQAAFDRLAKAGVGRSRCRRCREAERPKKPVEEERKDRPRGRDEAAAERAEARESVRGRRNQQLIAGHAIRRFDPFSRDFPGILGSKPVESGDSSRVWWTCICTISATGRRANTIRWTIVLSGAGPAW